MPDKPSETFQEGVEAGLEGKTNEDNPHSSGAGVAVTPGTLADPIAEQDRAAGEWEAGREEGELLSEEKNK